jgi:hypothetical protein
VKKIITKVLVTAFAVGGLVFSTTTPASADPCVGDPYWCSGKLPVKQFPAAWISLETFLGSGHHEYARGHAKIPENRWLYLDIKELGGKYRGWVNKVKGNGTRWPSNDVVTEGVFDGRGYQVRACTDTANVFTCTGWH